MTPVPTGPALAHATLHMALNFPLMQTRISHSNEVAQWFEPLGAISHEELWCVLLARDCTPKKLRRIARGESDSIRVRPRDVLRPVIVGKAAAFILVHNHPSGDATPSRADRTFTEQMSAGAEILGVGLVDHIVIGRCGYFSFADEASRYHG